MIVKKVGLTRIVFWAMRPPLPPSPLTTLAIIKSQNEFENDAIREPVVINKLKIMEALEIYWKRKRKKKKKM